MKGIKVIIISILILILFSSCADTVPYEVLIDDSPYGFFGGLWHGICVPISFFGSIFFDDIAMYVINNNGGWYDFGFFLGIGGLSSIIRTSINLSNS